jgi:hypothetical protein
MCARSRQDASKRALSPTGRTACIDVVVQPPDRPITRAVPGVQHAVVHGPRLRLIAIDDSRVTDR